MYEMNKNLNILLNLDTKTINHMHEISPHKLFGTPKQISLENG